MTIKTKMIIDNNIPAGNWEDKYNSKNPIARVLLHRFIKTIKNIIQTIQHQIGSITEIGCGEGNLISEIKANIPAIKVKACDFSEKIIKIAKKNYPSMHFHVKNIYDISEEESADLLLCCEVLEHLELPGKALERLNRVTKKYCILSVPNEPLWRILNFARGKYLRHFGNTPGHVQHWSSHQFVTLIQKHMDVLIIKTVLPWTIVLAKKK